MVNSTGVEHAWRLNRPGAPPSRKDLPVTDPVPAAPGAPPTVDQGHPRKWWILIVVSFGMFMALLDVTIVNIAMPAIITDLHTTREPGLVGAQRVQPRARRLLPLHGQGRRPLRAEARLHLRPRDLHALLAALRLRPQHRVADRLPRRPGPRRRGAAHHLAGDRARRLPQAAAGGGRRHLGRAGHRRRRSRPGPRRRARDLRPLVVDLLRQRARSASSPSSSAR